MSVEFYINAESLKVRHLPGTDMNSIEDKIRTRAHQLWEEGGQREGNDLSDWLRAEQLVLEAERNALESCAVDESSRESFPASDAPSTHTADIYPVNAEEKWAAASTD